MSNVEKATNMALYKSLRDLARQRDDMKLMRLFVYKAWVNIGIETIVGELQKRGHDSLIAGEAATYFIDYQCHNNHPYDERDAYKLYRNNPTRLRQYQQDFGHPLEGVSGERLRRRRKTSSLLGEQTG